MTKAFLRDGNVLQARIPMPPKQQKTGAEKYHGEVASGYDAKREDSDKWKNEQAIMERWLGELRPESVVDVPVGTGRFLPLYRDLGVKNVLGIDLSEDMLREASQKASDGQYLRIGDARDLGVIGQYDVAVCCRLMRWLETNEMQLKVISELCRVARRAVVFNVRTTSGPLPLSFERLIKDLPAEWFVANREPIVEDFTMFMLERGDEAPAGVVPE